MGNTCFQQPSFMAALGPTSRAITRPQTALSNGLLRELRTLESQLPDRPLAPQQRPLKSSADAPIRDGILPQR